MAAFESEEVINMDEEIEKRNEDNILHSGLPTWLKEINLLEYSGKFLRMGTMTWTSYVQWQGKIWLKLPVMSV